MFKSRKEAGEILAEEFKEIILSHENVVIIALPRGGVPVAYEIARHLDLPLDIFCVKKIGAPNDPELALGAISEEGETYLNQDIISHYEIDELQLRRLANQKQEEAKQQARDLRGGLPPIELAGKNVFIVDDGIATGATMKLAIKVLKQQKVNQTFVIVPVCSRESWNEISDMVDDIFVLDAPNNFLSVGGYYLEFPQVTNSEVSKILNLASTKGVKRIS